MFALGTKSLKCEFTQICVNVFQLPSTALTGGGMALHPPCTLSSLSLPLPMSVLLFLSLSPPYFSGFIPTSLSCISFTHPTPTSSPGVESDFSLQNSLRLSVTPRREQANAERGLEMFLLPRGCPLEVEASRQGWQLHRTDSAATRKAASVVPGPRCQPLPVERRYLGCSRENLEVKMDDCDADLV